MRQEPHLGSFIGRRRSVRRYRPDPIGQSVIEGLLHAAGQAPSAHNRQPWRFAVLQDRTRQEQLASAMAEHLRRDRTQDCDDAQSIESDVARSRARLSEAPVVIIVSLDMGDMDSYPDARRRRAEYLMAVQSTAMATQNLLLAAEQEGLGTCIMCAPLFCPDAVAGALALPRGWEPQMLVTLGLPAKSGRERPRLPLSRIAVWGTALAQLAR
jgi:coenzyme F420-0:L-glutamate ligase/coenzyme F420-1:gamma-L-glutamate ligase